METKSFYLVHVYRKGIYFKTCSIVFGSYASAEDYANHCGYYGTVEQVSFVE